MGTLVGRDGEAATLHAFVEVSDSRILLFEGWGWDHWGNLVCQADTHP